MVGCTGGGPQRGRALVEHDARASRLELEDRIGRAVSSFAYPFGYHSASGRRAVRAAGYRQACAVGDLPARPGDDRWALPRLQVWDDTTPEALVAMVTWRPPLATRASGALQATRLASGTPMCWLGPRQRPHDFRECRHERPGANPCRGHRRRPTDRRLGLHARCASRRTRPPGSWRAAMGSRSVAPSCRCTERASRPRGSSASFASRLGDAWDRAPVAGAPPLERATVVVPTAMSRPEQLRSCVRGLTELDHPDYEVIVVDNRPAGASPIELPGVRVVREPRPGISAARNRGLAEATGEIVAFTDDDVEVDRRWLRALGERFARAPEVAAVTGLVVPAEFETPAQIFFEQSGSGLDRGYAPLTFERAGRFQIRRRDCRTAAERVHSFYEMGELGLGSNMAFRTSVLRDAGGFDEALGTGTPTRGGEDLAVLVELLTDRLPARV